MYHDGSANAMPMQYLQMQGPGFWPGTGVPNQNQDVHGPPAQQMFLQASPQGMDVNPMMRRVVTFPTIAYGPNGMVSGLSMNRPVSPSNASRVMAAGGSIYGMPAPISMMHQSQAHMLHPLNPQRSVSDSGTIASHENSYPMREDYHNHSHHPGGMQHPSDTTGRGYMHPHPGSFRSAAGSIYSEDGRSGNSPASAGSPGGGYHAYSGPRSSYPPNEAPMSRSSRYPNHSDRNRKSGYSGGGSDASSMPNIVRDSLVEEFRNTYGKTRQWTLHDLSGHTISFCQDQHGSRFIQQRLEVASREDKQFLFEEILPSASSLMTDVFGNYVLQKLFEFGNEKQCDLLASLLANQCVGLSMHMYGCRVIQKALEYVSASRLQSLIMEFESSSTLIDCVNDANGNHVIQKAIEIVSKAAKDPATDREIQDHLVKHLQFIADNFHQKVKELSSHPYGCRVIQRILEHGLTSMKAAIMEELKQHSDDLIQDCYGNYVIQFVIQYGQESDRGVFFKTVLEHLIEYSQHKFASNVVEKCLQHASKRDRDDMIWKMINVTFDTNNPIDGRGNSALEAMVRDPYANYVVQKVIDVSDEKQRAAILKYVRENILQLRRYTYGKHIIMRLEKITNEKF
jgi:hypothetical protein